MSSTVEASNLSREQIVDRMNDLADQYGVRLTKGNGKSLTIDTFEKWLNYNDTSRVISLKALMVFCAVTESVEPVQIMVEPLGWMIIGDQDSKLLMWAKEYHLIKESRRKMRRLEEEL